MRGVFIAAGVALAVSILLTPYLIRFFARQGFGQEIRDEGPQSHKAKRGTPTMGGVAILIAIWVGYLVSHGLTGEPITASALLVLFLTTALGIVGFLDDFIKLRRQRNLGLNKTSKLVGQLLTAVIFGILAGRFVNGDGLSPASTNLSFVRDITVISFGVVGFVVFGYFVIAAWSNAVNLTDGLDGLATGLTGIAAGTLAVFAYIMGRIDTSAYLGIFYLRGAGELTVFCAAILGACIGFLWYNAAPAQVFMGDTGSLALGGALGAVAVLLKSEFLLLIIGAVFVAEMISVIMQRSVFKWRRRRFGLEYAQKHRVFLRAPLHHHFEMKGWPETQVVVRFWILGILCAMFALSTLKLR